MMDQPISAAESAAAAERLEQTLFEVKKIIVGQDRVVERLLVCLLARGHALLEGVPGLAKTLAAETIARVVGGSFTRIQFTPDLLPADVMGTRIYRAGTESFDVELGPVFANFVLADEINRAPAKVQSALLEVMAEHQVSIGGQTFEVPEPFLVLATQNPIEQEGVYPLPEAQRDRFLMKIVVEYPSPGEEVEIVQRMGVKPPEPSEALSIGALGDLQAQTDRVFVAREVVDYAVNLVFATREPHRFGLGDLAEFLQYGASPRASLGLIAGGRALALLRGRSYVLPQDVYDVAPDIFRHRLVLTYEALARNVSVNDVLGRILSTVPAPRVAPSQDPSSHHAGPGVPSPETSGASPWPTAPAPTGWDAAAANPSAWVPSSSVPAPAPQPSVGPEADEDRGWAAPGGAS
ncbi:MAG: AAA family ATPase [Acidimicrobiales bacterium]|nr:AAA family ATPase [Acidimicrobiales bacterium]